MATPKDVLDVAKVIIDQIEADLVLPDGQIDFSKAAEDIKFVQDVETALKAKGVIVPANLDKVLAIATALVTTLGS
jgi:hypothetical protein